MDSYDDTAVDSRWIIDYLPKFLLLFTVLFALPRYFWDSYVGGSLKSYLQYMQYLIERIKTELEKKENGYYGEIIQKTPFL